MNCKNCGAVVNEGEKFCGQCGTVIETSDAQNSQPYQPTTATEWYQSSAQSQQNQQYQYSQTNQQYQYNQQTQGQQQYQQNPQQYQNQQKSKDGKAILIIVLCIIIIPAVLFLMIFFGLGIFIFNSATDTVKNAHDTVTGIYDSYNWMNDENQSIDNPPSIITGSENTVKLKGYTLTIPSTVEGKANTLNTEIDLTSKDSSWIGQITTTTISYKTLKEQKEQASALLSRMISGENATSSDLKTESIGGVEYLISEISSSEGTGLLCYTELNSTTTAIVVIYNTDGTASRNALTDVSKIIRSAK